MLAEDKETIAKLRAEAGEVKDCFTRFSFQAIAFSAIVFGLLGRLEASDPTAILASVIVVTMLLAVARIGTYKYGNANTLYGYELHLQRTKRLSDTETGWKMHMRSIGWEEAIRSWRVVQPTVFRFLYYWHPLIPNWLRSEHKRVPENLRWFEPEALVKTAGVGAAYHPGGYLRLMLGMLHVLAALATLPLWTIAYRLWPKNPPLSLVNAFVASALVVFVLFRVAQDHGRLAILEKGILSIHSCAVMWQAVVLAHYRALEATRIGPGVGYENYTMNLAVQADSLRKSVFRIDSWMGYG